MSDFTVPMKNFSDPHVIYSTYCRIGRKSKSEFKSQSVMTKDGFFFLKYVERDYQFIPWVQVFNFGSDFFQFYPEHYFKLERNPSLESEKAFEVRKKLFNSKFISIVIKQKSNSLDKLKYYRDRKREKEEIMHLNKCKKELILKKKIRIQLEKQYDSLRIKYTLESDAKKPFFSDKEHAIITEETTDEDEIPRTHIQLKDFSEEAAFDVVEAISKTQFKRLSDDTGKIPAFEDGTGSDIKKAEKLNDTGADLAMAGKHEEAIKYYDAALKLNPSDHFSWANKGLSLNKLGKPKEALKFFDKALSLEPNYLMALQSKGLLFLDEKMYEEAIKNFQRMLEIDPKNIIAQQLIKLAKNPIKINRKKSHEPDGDEVNLRLEANSKMFQGRYEEALKLYNNIIEQNPDEVIFWINKGVSELRLKKFEQALKTFNHASAIEPNNPLIMENKADTLLQLGRLEEALANYDKALELDKETSMNFAIWSTRGFVLKKLGKYREAINSFEKALEINRVLVLERYPYILEYIAMLKKDA